MSPREQQPPLARQTWPLAPPVAAALIAILLGCSSGTVRDQANPPPAGEDVSASLVEVDLMLNWFPEAEHGGYYAALAHGFYEQQGLRVRILPGGPGVPVLAQVASGRVAFGVSNADTVLLGWAQEARTIAVFAPLQVSPRCIMVHEKSGIRRLSELKNVTLAMNPSSTFSLYLQKKLALPGVRIVPYSGNVAQFVIDPQMAQQAYTFSEPYVARQRGSDPHCLPVSDLGFNPYTSLLITGRETLDQRPEIVRKMVAASIRGWQQYLQEPATANRLLSQQNNEVNSGLLDYGAQQLRSLCVTPDVPLERIGQMTPQRWQTLMQQLVEVGAVGPAAVQPESVFTTDFLTD
jgi:NitT/TauT family transport system substrate-binding protein